jgi:hypothetical protein
MRGKQGPAYLWNYQKCGVNQITQAESNWDKTHKTYWTYTPKNRQVVDIKRFESSRETLTSVGCSTKTVRASISKDNCWLGVVVAFLVDFLILFS